MAETDGGDEVRIACLLPSATDICVHLGLADAIVGVTHECDVDRVRQASSRATREISTLTRCGLSGGTEDNSGSKKKNPSQREIDSQIKKKAAAAADDENCSNVIETLYDDVKSLYPILHDVLTAARPTVVLTQDLCGVCAPTTKDVQECASQRGESSYSVVSMHPSTLEDVGETFVQVAMACGLSRDVGISVRDEWRGRFQALRSAIDNVKRSHPDSRRPKVLLLEWLDPPFDAGHWIPDLIENVADCEFVQCRGNDEKVLSMDRKSRQVSWDDVLGSQPDVLMVACCGFELHRNVQDAIELLAPYREQLRNTRIYAGNGNLHFARPGPFLLAGAVVLCLCAYHKDNVTLEAVSRVVDSWNNDEISSQAVEGVGWERISLEVVAPPVFTGSRVATSVAIAAAGGVEASPDVEDTLDYMTLHKRACDAGENMYLDPATGYQVFTEVAHIRRGKCCGSGCRHCPYHHANVKDHLKTSRISQPAFLVEAGGLFCRQASQSLVETNTLLRPARKTTHLEMETESDNETVGEPVQEPTLVKLLFFSSGKDSFLTLRALVRNFHQDAAVKSLGIILLTTFDAESRLIAHQDVSVEEVVRQASHLQIPLVGVPLHRASSESYVDRIASAIALVEKRLSKPSCRLSSLVFGDLHLQHVRSWRDQVLGKAPALQQYQLEYPLWQTPYGQLLQDLEASGVLCRITGTTTPHTELGEAFGLEVKSRMESRGMDGFGEGGEFHSLAQVWVVSREQALGLDLLVGDS